MNKADRIAELKRIAQKGMQGIHNPYNNMPLIEKATELRQFLTIIDKLNNDLTSLNRLIQTVQNLDREANPQFTTSVIKYLNDDILKIKQAAGALK